MTRADIVSRYERDNEGRVLIDVSAQHVEDLYDDFDRHAPHLRRDLDDELVEYLINSGEEIADENIAIRFILATEPDQSKLDRVRASIPGFFNYLMERERESLRRLFRRAAVLFGAGLAILVADVWLKSTLPAATSVWSQVVAEGLTIAAWIALWEGSALLLLDWFPKRRAIRLYRKLGSAPLIFVQRVES